MIIPYTLHSKLLLFNPFLPTLEPHTPLLVPGLSPPLPTPPPSYPRPSYALVGVGPVRHRYNLGLAPADLRALGVLGDGAVRGCLLPSFPSSTSEQLLGRRACGDW